MSSAEHIILDAIIFAVALLFLFAVWLDAYLERRERNEPIEVEPEEENESETIHDMMKAETRFGRWGVRERR